jgi:hypothetical protein
MSHLIGGAVGVLFLYFLASFVFGNGRRNPPFMGGSRFIGEDLRRLERKQGEKAMLQRLQKRAAAHKKLWDQARAEEAAKRKP